MYLTISTSRLHPEYDQALNNLGNLLKVTVLVSGQSLCILMSRLYVFLCHMQETSRSREAEEMFHRALKAKYVHLVLCQ